MRYRNGSGRRLFACLLSTVGACVAITSTTSVAYGAQHLIKVREVYPGSVTVPGSEFVELEMFANGQQFVQGHTIRTYGPSGAQTGSATFNAPVANGLSGRAILAATPEAQAQFGVVADIALPPAAMSPDAGAVCWDAFDCVSWGGFSGATTSPTGSPAAAIPDGASLCRSIADGNPNALEASDDTNSSAADFGPDTPSPRNNANAAAGTPCTSPPPAGGGGGGSDTNPPSTTIDEQPKRKSAKRKAAFEFSSNEAGSKFECKLDKSAFVACASPFKTKIRVGKHRFQVRATDDAGNTDPTPAVAKFKRVARR